MEALIYKVERLNTHNGPGFRTVIYFKGCPLHCIWCHNPEGISSKPDVWFNTTKCIGCETCVAQCPEQALVFNEKGIQIDRKRCGGCQHCVAVCPTKAMEPIGIFYSVEELIKIIKQDKMLFDSSGGGITVTGGEPGSQPDFVVELFKQCRAIGVNTAFDTSGIVPLKNIDEILPFTDTVFLDIKILNDQKSRCFTGLPLKSLEQTIKHLNTFQQKNLGFNIEIRTPLIPGVNDDNECLIAISQFVQSSFTKIPNWELCLFNDLCEDKYKRLGMEWTLKGKKYTFNDYRRFEQLKNTLPLLISLSGFVEKKN